MTSLVVHMSLALFNNKSKQFPVTTVCRKKSFSGLLTNLLKFTPLCYKIGLVKTLIDRTFKINNTWLVFTVIYIQSLFTILRKNLCPEHVLDMFLHRYITRAAVGNETRPSADVEHEELPKHCFKIPFTGHF